MRKYLFILMIILPGIMVNSCKKKEDNKLSTGKVQFSINNKINSELKAALLEEKASDILVSIEDNVDKSVYESEKVELYNFNGTLISKPLALNIGHYNLTKFMVLDSTGKVIYATPVKGSPKAYLVQNPVPISFTISEDEITKLTPEVLSTSESTAADFGYMDATFEVVNTFDFLVSVYIYDSLSQNFQFTDASITISDSIKDLYTLSLDAKTNKITVNDGYGTYKITVAKAGYASFVKAFTNDSLKAYFNTPLVVVLIATSIDITSGLVAYYPFNGNPNDISGNGKNGTDHGSSQYLQGLFNLCRSFANSPTTVDNFDYTTIPNVINSTEFTVSFWAKLWHTGTHQSFLYLSLGDTWVFANLWLFSSQDRLAAIVNGLDLRTIDYSHEALINGQFNSSYLNSYLLQSNQYYFITCIFKNSVLTFYVNGQKYSEYLDVNRAIGNPNTNIILGVAPKQYTSTFYYPWYGSIDELRIYNRGLSADEISYLYSLSK